ncbi:hypothetical protein HOY80DRAFT_1141456 [Tuber brumale]|nr:hypothetical protein HOY80DRAFT_1141456 [Tuber brumale]
MSSPASTDSDHPTGQSVLVPAGVLETAGVKLCIVGTAAVQLYGSDLVLADLELAISDSQFDAALSILHARGYRDVEFDPCNVIVMPVFGGPGGWVARRLVYPHQAQAVVLYPASCWHLDINDSTTFYPEPRPYRFPQFLVYLEALIKIIDALVPIGGRTIHIWYLYSIMAVLLVQRPDLRAMISPGDRFFMDFYMKQNTLPGQLKVLRLRRSIMEGSLSLETAREIVPRPDLARKRIKEKYLRMHRGAKGSGGTPGNQVVAQEECRDA